MDGLTLDGFATDLKTQSAVLYPITILGEAVKRLSPEFRAQHSAIDWRAIAGMRDKLIHDYGKLISNESGLRCKPACLGCSVRLSRFYLRDRSWIALLIAAIAVAALPTVRAF